MGRHWDSVTKKVNAVHTPIATGARGTDQGREERAKASGWDDWTPERIRERKILDTSVDESDSDEDNKDKGADKHVGEVEMIDKEMNIMRRVVAKWARLANVESRIGEELKENEFKVDWTKVIAPRVEGRIICVGGEHL